MFKNRQLLDHNYHYQAAGFRAEGSAQPKARGSKPETVEEHVPKTSGWEQQPWSKKKNGRNYCK